MSSRALGAMVKGMGESSFDDLLPWLMQTLTSESSSVDRSGAAQGLAEVCYNFDLPIVLSLLFFVGVFPNSCVVHLSFPDITVGY